MKYAIQRQRWKRCPHGFCHKPIGGWVQVDRKAKLRQALEMADRLMQQAAPKFEREYRVKNLITGETWQAFARPERMAS